MENVFVYGTLRKGSWNNYILSDSILIAEGKTKEKFKLIVDRIPYVLKSDKVSNITGEVYEVDSQTLNRLDNLEGHPTWYRREKTEINTPKGSISAWLYFYPENVYSSKVISTGDFLNP